MSEGPQDRQDRQDAQSAAAARDEDWQRSQTLQTLRRLLTTSGQVAPALARRTGLSQTELSVLEHVMEEPMGPSELAQRVGVTTAAASGIVDRLVARGHAERQPHPTDRRRTAVVCTASGREEMMGHLMPMFLELAQLDAGLSEDERVVIRNFLAAAIHPRLADAERAVGRLL